MIESEDILKTIIGHEESVTFEEIQEGVLKFIEIQWVPYDETDIDRLVRHMQAHYIIKQAPSDKLDKKDENNSWLYNSKDSIDFQNGFWGRYKKYLELQKGYPRTIVNRIDTITDDILDSLFDPKIIKAINKRGLVVGNVQSGKTANYTGLICKAADSGFNMIIVLAGIHSNLRTQTQYRLDEGFLGFNTKYDRGAHKIGVGKYNDGIIAHSITTSHDDGDFTAEAARKSGINFNTNDPIIAVVKKHPKVLEKLFLWLDSKTDIGEGIRNKSLLLVDDEADHASINISNTEVQSSINGWITRVLGVFEKNVYVGYTATPFANIFIPMDDNNLFPRNFIHSIPPPSNYVGPEKVFGVDYESADLDSGVLPLINNISDFQWFIPNKHKQDDPLPDVLPESMERALIDFMLVCAIRLVRGHSKSHNSMLIHVTRFKRWQSHIAEKVNETFKELANGITHRDPRLVKKFQSAFEDFSKRTNDILNSELKNLDHEMRIHSWDEVVKKLPKAVSKIQVRSIHGGSKDVLDYIDEPNGLSVIAVGGNKLSRGLTLEGLSVSYYLRSSKMYDTLMQMGRWFGYRPGYPDLCRLYISDELNDWFCHVTLSIQELMTDFRYMTKIAGSTPSEFALKVRTHPTILNITATNKMRGIEKVKVSWSATLNELHTLKLDTLSISNNYKLFQNLLSSLGDNTSKEGFRYYWDNVPNQKLQSFLENFDADPSLKRQNPIKISQYIGNQVANNELTKWNILVAEGSLEEHQFSQNIKVKKTKRSLDKVNNRGANALPSKAILSKNRIGSPNHESVDLDKQQYNRAREQTEKLDLAKSPGKAPRKYPAGNFVRELRSPKEGLIVFYVIDVKSLIDNDELFSEYGLSNNEPLIGFMISFPRSQSNVPVEYAVHQELINEFHYYENED